MKTIIKIILFFLFSNSVYAYCDFELIKMERSLKEFSSKTKFIPTDENFSNDLVTFPLPVEEVCTDKDFIMFPVHFTFINKKLHQIFIEDMFNKVNHLKNLSYSYGEPTESYEDDTTTGIKYYHWDLNFKHVFLVIKFSQDQQTQNIEIVSNKFPTLLEKINEGYNE